MALWAVKIQTKTKKESLETEANCVLWWVWELGTPSGKGKGGEGGFPQVSV